MMRPSSDDSKLLVAIIPIIYYHLMRHHGLSHGRILAKFYYFLAYNCDFTVLCNKGIEKSSDRKESILRMLSHILSYWQTKTKDFPFISPFQELKDFI